MYTLDFSGRFLCKLDNENKGLLENWQLGDWEGTEIKLPGSLAENKLGSKLNENEFSDLTEASVQRLRSNYSYLGLAWYKKSFTVPKELENKSVSLFLERIIFQSRLWINGRFVAANSSLSTPHTFEISDYLKYGEDNLFVIAVDNRDVEKIGVYPSAYTEETQTIWNGIAGKMELIVSEKTSLDCIQIFTDLTNQELTFKFNIINKELSAQKVDVKLCIKDCNNKTVATYKRTYEISEALSSEQFELALWENCVLWDEFNPYLYKVTLTLEANDKDTEYSFDFGVREISASGRNILLNGKRIDFRGTLDCAIFPKTGYPDTDLDYWMNMFTTIKEYGLNHVRFHSWCPPEAAFIAGDKLGVYLQAEGPLWMDYWTGTTVGCQKGHYDYLPSENLRIVNTYGNHASFCILSNGNELNGDFDLLATMISKVRAVDKRHLYTLSSNYDRPRTSEDDIFIASTIDTVVIRGEMYLDKLCSSTELNFDNGVQLCKVPFIAHEIGQYAVYPDVSEIDKYDGVLNPVNFKAIKKDLEKRKLIKYAREFVDATGHLSHILYKAEIEAALATKDMAGFQLLGLHDFTGQGTATVGLLNVFWESKNFVSSRCFSEFCNDAVILFQTDHLTYSNNEELRAVIKVHNFSNADMNNANVVFEIKRENEIFRRIKFENVSIPRGGLVNISTLTQNFSGITEPAELDVYAYIENTEIKNKWKIWVYPEIKKFEAAEQFKIYHGLTPEILKEIEAGENVLLVPEKHAVKEAFDGRFTSVFWSPTQFKTNQGSGIICNNSHNAFKYFPTDKYSDFQWKNALNDSLSIVIDNLPENFEPIVRVVPNFFYNRNLATLFEARVGKGKIFVCGIDIFNFIHRDISKKWLRQSIFAYLNSSSFEPEQTLQAEDLMGVFNVN